MPFEEKLSWVNAVVTVIVPVAYFAIMLGRLRDVSAAEISYQWPLLIAIGTSIVLTIVGSILAGIGTGISAELRGRSASDEIDRKDERDKQIRRHGDLIGFYVSSVGMVGVLALTMLEYEYFWIASALYLSFVVGTLVSSVVKIVAYHRGFSLVMGKPTRVTNRIRALRFAAGEMTQAELADRVGVTRQTVIAIEQGRYSPSLEMAFQIARVFGVPLDNVFQYPDSEGMTP